MLSSPIILFYSFIVIVVFAIGVAPTALWMRFGKSLSGAIANQRRANIGARYLRASAGAEFTPGISFVANGIGFAADTSRGLLFLAGEQGRTPAEAILPLANFRAYAAHVDTGGFIENNYIELLPQDPAAPVWRISCGSDGYSAYAIRKQLEALGLKEDGT